MFVYEGMNAYATRLLRARVSAVRVEKYIAIYGGLAIGDRIIGV